MTSVDDRLQALVSGLAERAGAQLRHELDTLLDEIRNLAADQRDATARVVRAEAEGAAASLVSSAIAAERAAAASELSALRAELEAARTLEITAAQAAERQAELAQADDLLESIRALDGTSSLSGALDDLTLAARQASGRAAVLIVRGATLKGWAHSGFSSDTPDAPLIELAMADAGVLGVAATSGEPQSTEAGNRGAGGSVPAPFTPPTPDRVGLAVPVVVDEQVVAVIYADDAGEQMPPVPSCWPEHVEILARHASRCLEALTARQTAWRRARLAVTAPGLTPPDAEGARRFARLLISEIKLYHEALVEEGRRAGDLRQRLGEQIARARQVYEERVPSDVDGRADYFEQELVRTLAGGDAVLLGRAS
jgi:hypothetical protein